MKFFLAFILSAPLWALSLSHPPDFSFISTNNLVLTGYADPDASIIEVNTTVYQLHSPAFKITTPLTLGKNKIQIRTKSESGQTLSTLTRRIICKRSYTDLHYLSDQDRKTIEDLATIEFLKVDTPEFMSEKPVERAEMADYLNIKLDKPYRYLTRKEGLALLLDYANESTLTPVQTAKDLKWISQEDNFHENDYFTRLDLIQLAAKVPELQRRIQRAYLWTDL